jgi:small subunit ribosomal protein S19e
MSYSELVNKRVTGGVTLRDVAAADFIKAYGAHLKKTGKMEAPKHVEFIKTGVQKELCPYDADWLFVRAAAVARKVYLNGGQGVGGLARVFGSADRRGTLRRSFQRSHRGLIRHILQQLEKMGIVAKDEDGGRVLTEAGQRDLDRIAVQVFSA